MIVVDVNVVAYFMIEGEKTVGARELLQRDPDWRLPTLWRHEFLNVLATFARQGGATTAESRALWQGSLELFGQREQSVDMEFALVLAAENGIGAYDAQYITLARQLQTVCVTEDRRLRNIFPDLTRSMKSFGTI
ncbi:MAG: type II toxin-antitoxin system VapC family toxin [Burkholderiales bacterium]